MILIVDDDEAMAENCSMYLALQGFQVSIAKTGSEALDSIRNHAPELLISDCEMPGMTGAQLSGQLRGDPATAQVPILLISGSLRSDATIGASFDAFLRKPFLAENLLVEVRKLLLGISAPRLKVSQGTSAII